MTATPSAAPSSRVASFIAEPAPARRGGTADMIAAVIGDIASAMPLTSGHDRHEDVPVRRVGVERAEHQEADGDQHIPADTTRLAPKRALSRGVSGRDDDHDRRHRQQPQRGTERRVAEDQLEVLRDEEHHAEHRHEDEDHAAGAGAERRVPEEAHVEHRLVDVQLPEHERDEHDGGDRERGERRGARPAVVGRLDEAVDERDDADDREHRADRVELRLLGVARLRHEEPAGDERVKMIGTLTRNTEPYQKWPSSQPLATGPIAPAAPVTLAQIAMAFVRSSGGKTLTRIDSVDGMMNAAPTPMSAAARDELPHLGRARSRSTHATRKTTRPNCSAPLRPKRSPSAPVVNSNPANTSEYDAITHCSCDGRAPSSRDSVGIATLRLELPTKTISRLRHSTASVHQRRAYIWASIGGASSSIKRGSLGEGTGKEA